MAWRGGGGGGGGGGSGGRPLAERADRRTRPRRSVRHGGATTDVWGERGG